MDNYIAVRIGDGAQGVGNSDLKLLLSKEVRILYYISRKPFIDPFSFYYIGFAKAKAPVVTTVESRIGGSLLTYVVSRLRPDVFTHPIWVHFGDKDKQISAETILQLLSAAEQLQKNDPEDACQILMVCAVNQNYAGQRNEALERMRHILSLAEKHSLGDELLWAGWGATAICFQGGDTERAGEYLQSLQANLRGQDEWVLANFVEMVEGSMCQVALTTESGEINSLQGQQFGDLMRITFEWLQQWGFSAMSANPEFQSIISQNNSTKLLGSVPAQSLSSDHPRHSHWHRIKQIARGELKLKWVANSAPHPTDLENQRSQIYSPSSFPNRSEFFSPTTPRNLSQGRPHIEPVSPPRQEQTFSEDSLLVYCLGAFRVYKNDQLINKWPGNKCRQVLKYLVVHRETPVNQEILMEQFWPGMDEKSARRNLYQAIYNLRQALQSAETDASYVLTEDNHYLLNSELEIWVDSEAFDIHCQSAQNLLASGLQDEAMEEFKAAENLYQDEFLAEDRYEDWPLVYRENLKNAYLDALDQLSQHFYASGQFAVSIYYCRKILGEDNCREDIHRRAMLSHLNLDQPHLALRQYHICVEALKKELDVSPMPATEELCKRIQQHRHK